MKKVANVVSFLFIIIFSYVIFQARTFPQGFNGTLGPGFFPMALAVMGIFLAVLQIIHSLKQEESHNGVKIFSKENFNVLFSMGLTVVYFISLIFLGFILSTALFLFILLRFFKVKNWIMLTLIPVITTGLIYTVFTVFLYVQLPSGKIF